MANEALKAEALELFHNQSYEKAFELYWYQAERGHSKAKEIMKRMQNDRQIVF